MSFSIDLIRKIESVDPALRVVLWAILEEIERHRETSVTRSDFTDLKAIVTDLAQAQRDTNQQIQELRKAQQETSLQIQELRKAQQDSSQQIQEQRKAQQETNLQIQELRKAQQDTEQEIKALAKSWQRTDRQFEALAKAQQDLAQTQQRAEKSIDEMRQAVAVLARSCDTTRSKVEGLSRSVAYSLENEAYRYLPGYLARQGIEVSERFIRTTIDNEEINLLAHGRRGTEAVIVVGESVLRLDDRQKFAQLERHVALANRHYGQTIIPVMITHYAQPQLLALAEQRGVIVVQSFEWAAAQTA